MNEIVVDNFAGGGGALPGKGEKTSMTITLYFAVKDGAYDPETGETEEAGMKVTLEGIYSAEEEAELVKQIEQLHSGQLRQISEEEYRRDYGDD